ncbi:Outer membrane lipoprotein-sorting protein [Halorhabdus sp. SVX81]|uniref:hypothetical protein n=1 Tax=Halorhabdus sp. SVX81 TaxID=2978283 RepID=UPI0023DC34F3|nr:hypothetical protein [Halorhabdus sp. SVX81]WEL18716.1 Outer membrane lipoprotein-sorting protein [Halorhabdus sp. SVX81]
MDSTRRGAIRLVGFAALVVGVLGIAAAAGFVVADGPTGEAVLSDVEEQYRTADSVVVDATVTVNGENTTGQFSVESVATAEGRMRVNVSDGGGYLLAGYDGNTSWLSSSELASPLVVRGSSALGNVSFSRSNGTASMAGLDAFLSETDADLTWDEGLDNESVERVRDAVNESDLPAAWNESAVQDAWSDAELPAEWNESTVSEAWNESELSADWNESAIPEKWNDSEFAVGNWSHASMDHNWSTENISLDPAEWSVSTVLAETNLTAERIETTTVDGQEVHVVAVSAPERDGELTLWVRTDDAAVVKQQLTTPRGTVTVEMETRFDVSPADSTFEPPMASTELGSEIRVDSLAALRASASDPLAVPSEDWQFEQGSALERPVSVTIGEYTADGAAITVLQSDSAVLQEFGADGRRNLAGDRSVTLSELSGAQADIPGLGADELTVAQWSENGQTVVVAGDLDESALLEAVETVAFE